MPSPCVPDSRRQLLIAGLCALALPAAGQTLERGVTVGLGAPGEARNFEDMICEYEAVLYQVVLTAGESVRIWLTSGNAANCFDIHAPGSPKPVYVGGESGNDHTLVAKVTGEYVVRVYLLRFAARDGQSAQYTLTMARAD